MHVDVEKNSFASGNLSLLCDLELNMGLHAKVKAHYKDSPFSLFECTTIIYIFQNMVHLSFDVQALTVRFSQRLLLHKII
jgi:hypothetical protein